MLFLSNSFLPSLSLIIYISLFRDLSPFGASAISVCLPFPFWKMTAEKNMIVHIVIDNKGGTVFHFLTVLGMVVLSLVVPSFGRTILEDSNSLLWDEGSGDTLKCNCGGYSVSMQVQVIG